MPRRERYDALEEEPVPLQADQAFLKAESSRTSVTRALACGAMNGILVTPVLMSFATIIFQDPAFAPYLPRLVRLVIVSGTVHQLVFTARSSLPFAVGSVQDAGLVFLSAMAALVATSVRRSGGDDATLLATTCFALCGATLALGAALVLTGRLRLASLVQYLPMPVVGGYLAWLGFFCGAAGLKFMAGASLSPSAAQSSAGESSAGISSAGVSSQVQLQLSAAAVAARVAPGVVAGVCTYLALRRFRSVATLPVCMVAIISIFYGVLAVTGTSLAEARSAGWVAPLAPSAPLWEAWSFFQPEKVMWSAMPRLLPNWAAMFLVVAFSSSLDIAAVEMELGAPVDYNRELQTVGWSNMVSGCLGGFTGSYIFSQTVFNLRAGVDSRLAGLTTAAVQIAVVALPVSAVSFVPRCFFGALLVLIATDLMLEWLWAARKRMMAAEYLVCLITFAAILGAGVQLGMALGVVAAVLAFAVAYARVPSVVTAKIKDSTVMRTFEERLIIKAHRHQVLVLSLQGYIFFGSAVNLLQDVKRHIVTVSPASTAAVTAVSDHPETGQPPPRQPPANSSAATPRRRGQLLQSPPLLRRRAAGPLAVHGEAPPLFNRRSGSGSGGGSGSPGSPALDKKNSDNKSFPARGLSTPSPTSGKAAGSTVVPGGSRSPSLRLLSGESSARGANSGHSANGGPSARTPTHPSSNNGLHFGPAANYATFEGEEETDLEAALSLAAAGGDTTTVTAETAAETDGLGLEDGWSEDRRRVHAYMSLWATSSFRGEPNVDGGGGAADEAGGGNANGECEESTRWLVLDFSSVLGVDATAARVCFLMLKHLLRASGVTLVFAGLQPKIRAVLQAHGVVQPEEPRFGQLDAALEWCEEQLLATYRAAAAAMASNVHVAAASPVLGPPPRPPPAKAAALEAAAAGSGSPPPGGAGTDDGDGFNRHPSYYDKARQLRQNSGAPPLPPPLPLTSPPPPPPPPPENFPKFAMDEERKEESEEQGQRASSSSDDNNGAGVGVVGSLRNILEDYLELEKEHREKAGGESSVGGLLESAGGYFNEEEAPAGTVLFSERDASTKLYFIARGAVELRKPPPVPANLSLCGGGGGGGRRDSGSGAAADLLAPPRLAKVSVGGSFGELGFFLKRPQAFRAVAIEDCRLYTLERRAMAQMQANSPELCILVQKAVLKSLCLAAAFGIEAQHFGP